MAKITDDDEDYNNMLAEEAEEIDNTPTWFDYWADTFQESITALISTEESTIKSIDPHEVVTKAKEIADEMLRELQYQHEKMGREEIPAVESTDKVQ